MGSEFIHGLLVGLAFIVAIGPQNAFVLKSGLLRQHIFTVCFICAASDAVLILSGIAGLDRLLIELPVLLDVFRYGGATFCSFTALLRTLCLEGRGSAKGSGATDLIKTLS